MPALTLINKHMKHLIKLLTALFLVALSAAPSGAEPLTEVLDSNNKIYVVVLVLATIFAGIIAFLVYLERRMNRLEKNTNQYFSKTK